MQQRPTSSFRAPDEHCTINITEQSQVLKHSPRRRMDDLTVLPIYDPRSSIGRKGISRSVEKWVHAVPVIVLLCLFVLWCFSYPVNLVIKDSRIAAIHRTVMPLPLPLNDTHVDLAILALAKLPIASLPQNMTRNNETEAHLVSETD